MAVAQAQLEVFVPADQTLRFGEPFELSVVATRAPGAVFDAGWLAPLVVENEGDTTTRGVGPGADRLEWRCRVRAFAVGELTLGGVRDVTLQPGGAVLRAQLAPLTLRIASVLPAPPGDYEWPGDVREPRRGSAWPYVLIAVVMSLTGVLMLRARRRVSPAVLPIAAPEVPAPELALAGLAALGDELDDLTFHTELANQVRRYLARRYDLHAEVRTSEELWQHHATGGAEALRDCLWRCDLVKFANAAPPRDERERARRAAIEFVRCTAQTQGAA